MYIPHLVLCSIFLDTKKEHSPRHEGTQRVRAVVTQLAFRLNGTIKRLNIMYIWSHIQWKHASLKHRTIFTCLLNVAMESCANPCRESSCMQLFVHSHLRLGTVTESIGRSVNEGYSGDHQESRYLCNRLYFYPQCH